MTQNEKETEQRILDAAKVVFLQKGMDGARMQEIAEEAGINKALLHYYFRSKEALFKRIFSETANQIFPKLETIFNTDEHLFIKIERFIDFYVELLRENPHFPQFVIHELYRNPDSIFTIFKESRIDGMLIVKIITKEIETGVIKPVDPRHLIINIISMCIFPVAARPLLEKLLFQDNAQAYSAFLDERKRQITAFIINAIKLN